MKPLGLSPRAAADLEEIAEYIAKDNPVRASSFVADLLVACAKIPAVPGAYPLRPELGRGVRVAIHGRYMIFFRDLPDEIRIDRVLHGARDLVRQFRQ